VLAALFPVRGRLPGTTARDAFYRLPLFKLCTEETMVNLIRSMWSNDEGQDIAEYAVMLAVILVIVVGTIRLIGSQANNVFSETASAIGS
jgi:Flp pilus assembly pilin Flp